MNAAINRAVSVEIDGEPFEMLLSEKATAELEREFGSMERISEPLDSDSFGASIETAAKQRRWRRLYRHQNKAVTV